MKLCRAGAGDIVGADVGMKVYRTRGDGRNRDDEVRDCLKIYHHPLTPGGSYRDGYKVVHGYPPYLRVVTMQEGDDVAFRLYAMEFDSLSSAAGVSTIVDTLNLTGHHELINEQGLTQYKRSAPFKRIKFNAFGRLTERLYEPVFGTRVLKGVNDDWKGEQSLVDEGDEVHTKVFDDDSERRALLRFLADTSRENAGLAETAGQIIRYLVFAHPYEIPKIEAVLGGMESGRGGRLRKAFETQLEKHGKSKEAYRFFNVLEDAELIKFPPEPGETRGRSYVQYRPADERIVALKGLEESLPSGKLHKGEVVHLLLDVIDTNGGTVSDSLRPGGAGREKALDEFRVMEAALQLYSNIKGTPIAEESFTLEKGHSPFRNPYVYYQAAAETLNQPLKEIRPAV